MTRAELLNAIDAIEKHLVQRSRIQASNLEATLLWIPVGIVLAYILNEYGGQPALAMVIAVAVLVGGTNYLAARGKKRLNNYLVDDLIAQDVEFEFLDTHIVLQTAHSSGRSEWALIKDAVETEEFVLLFIDNSQAYVIPKRIDASRSVYKLAKEKLASNAC